MILLSFYYLNTSYVKVQLKSGGCGATASANLNTSYVKVQQDKVIELMAQELNLNTSYVKVQLN